jgi:hypothetical protein
MLQRRLSDADIEQLLRALDEVRELEAVDRAHGGGAPLSRAFEEVSFSGAGEQQPTIIRMSHIRRLAWAAVGAAASLALWHTPMGLLSGSESTKTASASALPIRVSYVQDVSPAGGPRRDCIQSTPSEACSIVAVLRTCSSECQCLVWDLYRWDTGTIVARARAGEPVEIVANPQPAPPSFDQVVIFAVARERDLLPRAGEEADSLLECLLRRSPAWDGNGATLDQSALTVKSCLPQEVTVVPTYLSAAN